MEKRSDLGHRDSRNISRNVENLQLTEEERKVLRDCRVNSMIRGVPAGFISALVTKFAISSGKFLHLAQWSRFYYAVSFTGGLLFGVASYRKTCLEEIMKLENSALAEQVKEYYKRSGLEYVGPESQKKESGFNDSPASGYSYDLEGDSEFTKESTQHSSRPIDKEDKRLGSNDWTNNEREELKPNTFEELRKQNRQLWQQDQYPHVRSTKTMHQNSLRDNQPSDEHEHDSKQRGLSSNDNYTQGSAGIKRRNKYGDPIE